MALKKPRAVLIEDNEYDAKLASYILERHHAGWNVEVFHNYQAYLEWAATIGRKQYVSLFCLDYSLPGEDGLKIAERLAQDHRTKDVPRLLVTGRYMTELADKIRHSLEEDIIQGTVYKHTHLRENDATQGYFNEFHTRIDRLIANEDILNPHSVGIIGLGHLGLGIMQVLQGEEKGITQISTTTNYNDWYSKPEEYKSHLLNTYTYNASKLRFFESIAEVLAQGPDLLFLASSNHSFDPRQFKTRHETLRPTFYANLPKIERIGKELATIDSPPFIIPMANPPEHIACFLHHFLTDAQISSIAADELRTKSLFMQDFREDLERVIQQPSEISATDFDLKVVGQHGNTYPLLSTFRYNGQPLSLLESPRLSDAIQLEAYELDLQQRVNRQAFDSLNSSEIFQLWHADTLTAVRLAVRDLTLLRKHPQSFWMAPASTPERSAGRLFGPTTINRYKGEISLSTQLPDFNLNKKARASIESELQEQRDLVQEAVEQGSLSKKGMYAGG